MNCEGTESLSGRWKARLLLAVAGIALGTIALAEAATGKSGYAQASLVDGVDADSVTIHEAQALNSGLVAGSNGEVYVVAATVDRSVTPVYSWHELLAFDIDASGASGLRRVLSLRRYDAQMRAMALVSSGTVDGSGSPVLVAGNLLLLIDGYDHAADVSFRQLWMIDPSVEDPAPTILYEKSPEPSSGDGSVSGYVHLALASDGTVYVHTENAGTGSPDGSIRALQWSDAAGEYVEAAAPVTSVGTTTGPIAVGPDGFLYSFERTSASSSLLTNRAIRIDPSATDSWTTYATFSNKFGERFGPQLGLVFDGQGDLFLRSAYTAKGKTLHVVLPVPANGSVEKGTQIVESRGAFIGSLAADSASGIFLVERVDGLDTVIHAAPDSGSGGGGGGGNGGGKGHGKPK